MGQWNQSVVEKTYLHWFTPKLVLGGGGWPIDKLDEFWAPRFVMELPESLLVKMYPFFPTLAAQLKELEDARVECTSVRSMVECLRYLAEVVFQDALDLVHTRLCFVGEEIPCRTIKMLLEDAEFLQQLGIYSALHKTGVSVHSFIYYCRECGLDDQMYYIYYIRAVGVAAHSSGEGCFMSLTKVALSHPCLHVILFACRNLRLPGPKPTRRKMPLW